MGRVWRRLGPAMVCSLVALAISRVALADDATLIVPFTPDRWDLTRATVVEHLGRTAVMGTAFMKGVEFEDGVVECDVAVADGARTFPGLLFRTQSAHDYERVYLRPHRSPLHDDVVQYVASFNGVDSWQLYNGRGRTSGATLPAARWFRLRIEVLGSQARVFLADGPTPVLVVDELERGHSRGGLGISTASDGTAFFSNCAVRPDVSMAVPPPALATPPGIVSEWDVSSPLARREIELGEYPHACMRANAGWVRATVRRDGILDISRVRGRQGSEPDAVMARTTIRARHEGPRKYWIGYSDEVAIFVNGQLVFQGDNSYGARGAAFLGIVGPFDAVTLPLREGDNEVLFALGESSGGWGLLLQDANAVGQAPGVERAWATTPDFLVPESAVYDPGSNAFYVSNYDAYTPSRGAPRQFISKVSPVGQVQVLEWVSGLANPTGLAVRNGTLYAAERTGIAEIDIATASITRRTPIAGAGLLNDIAIADNGDVYVSDSQADRIYRVAGGQVEAWVSGLAIASPNGVLAQRGRLVVGTNGDGCVKAVDLASRQVAIIANLGAGLIDGIADDGAGGLLVSHHEGRLWQIAPDGVVRMVLDTTSIRMPIADVAYVPSLGLAVIPTFTAGRVIGYRVGVSWRRRGCRSAHGPESGRGCRACPRRCSPPRGSRGGGSLRTRR